MKKIIQFKGLLSLVGGVTLCFGMLGVNTANALTISRFSESAAINPQLETHIFVMGYAGGLADQFFKAATARARKYQEEFPDRQFVFIGPDVIDKGSANYNDYEEYRNVLSRLGLLPERLDEKWLLSNRLLEILESYTKISGIEFFSHSAAHLGVGLDEVPSDSPQAVYKRFNSKVNGLANLADNFTNNAFMVLHGCNSGFIQAPELSKLLAIPVAGSLSSTNTQEIYSDNKWYFNDSGRYPEGLTKARNNTISFEEDKVCSGGNCHRMKPEAYPYAGYWGNLNAGLSHYKFFCNEVVAGNDCKKAMALFMLGHPGIKRTLATKDDFKANAKDFLCPDSNRPNARRECFEKMEASLSDSRVIYTGMTRGKTLECDFKKCNVEIRCTDQQGSCQIVSAPENNTPKTMQNEFKAYVEGFDLLAQP